MWFVIGMCLGFILGFCVACLMAGGRVAMQEAELEILRAESYALHARGEMQEDLDRVGRQRHAALDN